MLEHWIWLSTRPGIGPRRTAALLQQFGSPEAVFESPAAAFSQFPADVVSALSDHDLSSVDAIIRQCRTLKIHILTLSDAAYPSRLSSIDDPPAVLYYRGTLPDFDSAASIAMVGTRHASAYGLMQAKRLGYELGSAGLLVVSGGAAGIDTMSLEGALSAKAPAVAVLGCGVDVVYPPKNAPLFRDLAALGCLVSEYPPGVPPLKEHFPARNRIISALSLGVLVVEAPIRSGALITAQFALDQGRDVFTLPANLGTESCAGNIRLLKEGALLVETGADVAQQYAAQFPGLKPVSEAPAQILSEDAVFPDSGQKEPDPSSASSGSSHRKDIDKKENNVYIDVSGILETLSPNEKAVVLALQEGPLHVDRLTQCAHLSSGQVLAALTLLEVKGYITRLPAQYFSLAYQ